MDFGSMDRRQLTMAGSGMSVLLTLHFTFPLLSQHLFYWKNPSQQKAIAVIILLAPLYAVNSFVGLLDTQGSKPLFMLLTSVKHCYDALAVATFLALIYSYLNISMSTNAVPDEIKGREIHHLFPMNLFQPRTAHLNHQTLRLLKQWTLQFVIIRPVCSILTTALQIIGMYPSWLNWTFVVVLNLSILLAMYALVVFYRVFPKELEPHKPLTKFICIVGIVFFSFWQGLVLDILVKTGTIGSHHFWLDTEHVGEAIQHVIVCVEMVLYSVLQQYAYHVSPYSGDLESKLRQRKY
ncbi:hypothetical protein ACP275_13G154000 [Erythranthe tilingii]